MKGWKREGEGPFRCFQVLYCARKAGVTHVLKAGGAQAVAAMAWGTETCPKVDKILGPGNQYVTAAKMLLQNSEAMISMDMPAGPSEVRSVTWCPSPKSLLLLPFDGVGWRWVSF